MLKPKPITYAFRCRCCNKETTTIFNENEYIENEYIENVGFLHFKPNPEWNNGFIYMMCVHCGSIMKMHKSNINKEAYKPSPWHKPSIREMGIVIIKNYFNPRQTRNKKTRGRFK